MSFHYITSGCTFYTFLSNLFIVFAGYHPAGNNILIDCIIAFLRKKRY